MKKCFYSMLMVSLFNALNGQQSISFEGTEGYSLATIIGQNGWTALNALPANAASITNNAASEGTQSLWVNNSGITGAKGLYKNLGTFPTNYEISFDMRHGGGSEIQLAGQPTNQMALNWGFLITSTGQFQYIDDAGVINPTTHVVPINTWTNFKIKVDNTGGSLVYYINNVQVANTTTLSSLASALFAFTIDPGSNGMYLDNIKVVESLLAVSEVNSKDEPSVYPNPTTDYITIKTNDKIENVEVLDLSGKLVLKNTAEHNKVNLSSLQAGGYLLKVKTSKGVTSKKIIKK